MPGDLEGADRKQILVFALGEPRYAVYLSTVERVTASSILSPLQNGEVA